MPVLSSEKILQALRTIIDPDLHENIVDLGFVQNLIISEKNEVVFDLVLTTPACPVRDQFQDLCKKALLALGALSVEVNLSSKERVHSNLSTENSYLKNVSNIIAVASGKGGVGKSTVTANLAMALSLSGARVGILDADIYGPSMSLMFGIQNAPKVHDDQTISPVVVKGGLEIISMSMFAGSDSATIWRGPMASQMIQNFLHRVRWGFLDYLLIDFPPGTGDIQLTLTQTAPISGAIMVTTPQEVALADCRKGLSMFDSVGVPVLGIVENMSYFICENCEKKHFIFRSGGGLALEKKWGVPLLSQIPIEPGIAEGSDLGTPIVLRDPNSISAHVFTNIAEKTIRSLAVLHAKQGQVLYPFSFTWEELALLSKEALI